MKFIAQVIYFQTEDFMIEAEDKREAEEKARYYAQTVNPDDLCRSVFAIDEA